MCPSEKVGIDREGIEVVGGSKWEISTSEFPEHTFM